MKKDNIASVSLKGGRKDQFYFCLLEHYEDSGRFFLKSLLQLKDDESADGNEALKSWIKEYKLEYLVVDFPLSDPECKNCELECPGAYNCPKDSVVAVRERINSILEKDSEIYDKHPKGYEQDRNSDDLIDYSKDILEHDTGTYILSRSFKRKLKKGFLPYWNRSLDFWIWRKYHDQLLSLFNISYDSFGSTSLMLLSRFTYLRRHFPGDLKLHEANIYIVLIELLRSGMISKKDLVNIQNIDRGVESRLNIIKSIEKSLNIFVYDSDLEILVKNTRAFDSFLLAVAGQSLYFSKVIDLPKWTIPKDTNFVIPELSLDAYCK